MSMTATLPSGPKGLKPGFKTSLDFMCLVTIHLKGFK